MFNRQEANLNALFPFIRLLPPAVTIDERKERDLVETVREVFSSHIGGALAGSNIVSRAVQVLHCSLYFVMIIVIPLVLYLHTV